MKRIKQLSPTLANQIAAGEVVTRPASVVKECVENSIDAGSTNIVLELEQGGCELIRIIDNGEGILKEDLTLAVTAHATSKLSEPEDLFNIHSLGFRGEALASIAAVSRFTLASKPLNQDQGWQICWDHDTHRILPAAQPTGTMITIKDLFYNVPARRKFLRSPKTELQQIMTVMKSLALSHFAIDFKISQQQKVLAHWPAVTADEQVKRINQILGNSFADQTLRVDCQEETLRLRGWINKPQNHRSHGDCQYVFINGRMVQDRIMNHGIRQAYGHNLPEGRQGAYVLYLELPYDEVDVNVHPTKREVRFQHSRLVHDFMVTQLQAILTQQSNPLAEEDPLHQEDLWKIEPISAADKKLAGATFEPRVSASNATEEEYKIIYGASTSTDNTNAYKVQEPQVAYESKPTESIPPNDPAKKASIKLSFQCLGLFETYYAVLAKEEQLYGLYLPQVIADYYSQCVSQGLKIKPLLMPVSLNFNEKEINKMESYYEIWESYGLACQTFNQDTLMIRGLPEIGLPLGIPPNDSVLQTYLVTLMEDKTATKIIGKLLGEWSALDKVMESPILMKLLVDIDKHPGLIPLHLAALWKDKGLT